MINLTYQLTPLQWHPRTRLTKADRAETTDEIAVALRCHPCSACFRSDRLCGRRQIWVVCTAGDATKTAFLAEKGVKIYYGDADGDMKQAIEVGARPIRVLRASNSTYKPMPKNGSFGEEVIVDSDH